MTIDFVPGGIAGVTVGFVVIIVLVIWCWKYVSSHRMSFHTDMSVSN